MSAPAPALVAAGVVPSSSEREWAVIVGQAPQLAGTARRYLDQIALSLRPGSVVVADSTLRIFCNYLLGHHPATDRFAAVGRVEIEGFKRWLLLCRTPRRAPLSANTIRQRLGMLRTFFDRIIEWDWPDAPARTPIFGADLPVADEPLPRFLDDAAATRLLRAAADDPSPLRRLVIELLAYTGLRVGELCALEADAVVLMGEAHWLRVPLGKLHNDRYVPLRPHLVESLAAWSKSHDGGSGGLLLTNCGRPLNRHVVTRMLRRVAKAAGIGHVHPHQLRHTLATQAVNRGMRLEAIALARSPQPAHDDGLRPHRQHHRRVPRHQRAGGGPLRRRRPGDAGHASPAQRAPAHAGQRLVHPAGRARLLVRVRLRGMRLLPGHHRVPPHDPAPARPRPRPRPVQRVELFDKLLGELDRDTA